MNMEAIEMSFQGRACTFIIAFVFSLSALAKSHRPQSVYKFLAELGLPQKLWLVLGVVAIEAELALRWCLGMNDLVTTVSTLALLFVFMLLLYRVKVRAGESQVRCACYGNWLKLTPWEAIKLDLIYVGLVILAWSEQVSSPFFVGWGGAGVSLFLLGWLMIKSPVGKED
jgi:hypothetical protein